MGDDWILIRILDPGPKISTMKLLRQVTGASLGDLGAVVNIQQVLPIRQMFTLEHKSAERDCRTLFSKLDDLNVKYEVLLDGQVLSMDDFYKRMLLWRDVGREADMLSQLEEGENSSPDEYRPLEDEIS